MPILQSGSGRKGHAIYKNISIVQKGVQNPVIEIESAENGGVLFTRECFSTPDCIVVHGDVDIATINGPCIVTGDVGEVSTVDCLECEGLIFKSRVQPWLVDDLRIEWDKGYRYMQALRDIRSGCMYAVPPGRSAVLWSEQLKKRYEVIHIRCDASEGRISLNTITNTDWCPIVIEGSLKHAIVTKGNTLSVKGNVLDASRAKFVRGKKIGARSKSWKKQYEEYVGGIERR